MRRGERGGLSDAEWERVGAFLPVSNDRRGRWRDHQQVTDGILRQVRTGGSGVTCPNGSGLERRLRAPPAAVSAPGNVAAAGPRCGRRGGRDRLGHLGGLHHEVGTPARSRRPRSSYPRGRGGRTPGRDFAAQPGRPPVAAATRGTGRTRRSADTARRTPTLHRPIALASRSKPHRSSTRRADGVADGLEGCADRSAQFGHVPSPKP
jgi:hypothetical protein